MEDTLLIGDHILVNKFIYGVRMPFSNQTLIPVSVPKRGDIIVFKFPEDPKMDFIKRVVGIPGDVVECRNKVVFINGKPENNDYAIHKDAFILRGSPRDNFGPIQVPEDRLFVMGDNRDRSNDSRFWKFVDYSQLRGKAFMIYWSWNKEDFAVRWRRIADMIE